MKVCTKCNLEKPESDFYQVKGRHIAACKECTKKHVHNSPKTTMIYVHLSTNHISGLSNPFDMMQKAI
jgi:hypothetical protein